MQLTPRIERGGPLGQITIDQHGQVRSPAQAHRDGRDRYFAKVQPGLRRSLLIPGGFLQIREDLLVHGGLRRRDEAIGHLIFFNAFLPVSRVNGELIVGIDR